MSDDGVLAELRTVFLEELEDHRATLAREAAALRAGEGGEGAHRASLEEIFRAVHSLKGAARAVGFVQVELMCHEAESELEETRAAPSFDPEKTAVRVATLLGDLEQWLSKLAAPAVDPLAPVAIEPPRDGSRPPPEPARSGERASEPPRAAATIRVSVARIDNVLASAEELAAISVRTGNLSQRFELLSSLLSDLRHTLVRAQQARSEDGELAQRCLSAVNTVSLWSLEAQQDLTLQSQALLVRSREVVRHARLLRVVRFDALYPELERAARDAAAFGGKRLELDLGGGEVEIDRRAFEAVREVLLHLVRNAADHGIEPPEERARTGKPAIGSVRVAARLMTNEVGLEVEDDGAGIDVERIREVARQGGRDVDTHATPELMRLLFEAGFTTRASASPLSGRGVGLNVVRERLAQMHGRVSIDSEPGRGARFSLVLPIDLTLVRALIVHAGDARFALVATGVLRLRRLAPSELIRLEGRTFVREGDEVIPLADLSEVLGLGRRSQDASADAWPCVVLAAADRVAAFRVDGRFEETEVLLKPLTGRIRRAGLVVGASLLADGDLALVLDAAALVRVARPAASGSFERPVDARPHLLVVDDSITTRQLIRVMLEAAGYEVSVAADGSQAWQLLAQHPSIALVVSDIEMPRMDGFQLLARMRASSRTARLPVELVTALTSEDDRQRALELGASAYMTKSTFDQTRLVQKIQELL